jgi:hypothetical protein
VSVDRGRGEGYQMALTLDPLVAEGPQGARDHPGRDLEYLVLGPNCRTKNWNISLSWYAAERSVPLTIMYDRKAGSNVIGLFSGVTP